MKIIGISEKLSGSRYHRVELPLSYLNGKDIGGGDIIETEIVRFERNKVQLSEDLFEKADFIVSSWIVNNPSWQISLWSQEHNCKFIQDWDDGLPGTSHTYIDAKTREIIRTRMIQQSVAADAVFVTNEVLASEFVKLNNRILISPNVLNYGQGQFTSDKVESAKIRIGIGGSISHYKEWRKLEGVIKRMWNDPKIRENCEFVMVGFVETDKKWIAFEDMFPKGSVRRLLAKSPAEYMELYKEVDIMLTYLEDNSFNKAKSSLLLTTCACKNIPVVGTGYINKDLNSYCHCKNMGDYYKWVKFLIQNDNHKRIGSKFGEEIRGKFTFEKRLEDFMAALRILKDTKPMELPEDVKIYGITYNEDHFTEYLKFDNSHRRDMIKDKTWRFEYNVLLDLRNTMEDNVYYGIFSYKFPTKTAITKNILCSILHNIDYKSCDVVNLCPEYFKVGREYFTWSEQQHPGLLNLLEKVCKAIDLDYTNNPNHIVYSNFFICRGSIYKGYIDKVKQALEVLEGSLWELANKDSGYKTGLDADNLEKMTGMRYYNMVTFVLERMFSIYINDLKVKQLGV